MIDAVFRNPHGLLARATAKLSGISNRILILWCYFMWYLVMVVHCFDSNPSIWVTAIGISMLVGIALNLSTGGFTKKRLQDSTWEVLRLFLVPFCVSSFSALVKDKGFFLVIAPDPYLNYKAVSVCCACMLLVLVSRYLIKSNRSRK